jgi:hypothetical protein
LIFSLTFCLPLLCLSHSLFLLRSSPYFIIIRILIFEACTYCFSYLNMWIAMDISFASVSAAAFADVFAY